MAVVAKVYGDALYDLATETGRMDEFYEEAVGLAEVIASNPELVSMMNHPRIEKQEKKDFLVSVFKGKISDEMLGLMDMMVEKEHFANMDQVLTYFEGRVKECKHIGVAYVTTPTELKDTQKAALVSRLEETTAYESFEMHYAVDESLIGGMVIRIGDRVVDSSIRTKLDNLGRELSKVQLKNSGK